MSEGIARAACAPAAQAGAGTRERVLGALDGVIDPELDEPITTLRFITSCEVSADGDVDLLLRLPTPQCAPNFAFLMAADARAVVRGLPGVRQVRVRLEDHYTGEEINGALGRGEGRRRRRLPRRRFPTARLPIGALTSSPLRAPRSIPCRSARQAE